ncbi:MAG: hypothetical protein GF383_04265 [Candidatus Lokiarchaeota archaeon]|nr:hypothetical protein [Candidatus Lokiarchaeota archaeon]MBD3338972.1 hypothetical protein [Candidatus Lokiarchaeota archaeon]
MSIHGNQYLLPYLLNSDGSVYSLNENQEMTIAFYLLTKDLNLAEERILSFSRLLWPLLSIQGVISTHLILDGLGIFSKKGKFSNPPRQPLIGHYIRNVDNRKEDEILKKIIEILTYQDTEAKEIGTGEESEFQTLNIPGLINPEYLNSLLRLIPKIEYKPINNYSPLDTIINTDKALDISEEYRNCIDTMKGNAQRWKSQISLIDKEINKWLTNLNVELKDIDLRYNSQINKTSEEIDAGQMKKLIEVESDKIDQWRVSGKKNIIENISVLFKTIERDLQEILKKNRFFGSEESLKSRVFEDLIPTFEKHFDYLEVKGKKFLELIDSLRSKYEIWKEKAIEIENEAKTRLEKYKNEVRVKLNDRDEQLTIYQHEKKEQIEKIEEYKKKIEQLFIKIKNILHTKTQNCLKEAQELTEWSIRDTDAELFSKPVQWIYMPVYVIFIENEDMMEERMDILLPGYLSAHSDSLYESLSESFKEMRSILVSKVEDDMKVRSNFEFSSENKNLLNNPDFKNSIEKGIAQLTNRSLINSKLQTQIREKLKLV